MERGLGTVYSPHLECVHTILVSSAHIELGCYSCQAATNTSWICKAWHHSRHFLTKDNLVTIGEQKSNKFVV